MTRFRAILTGPLRITGELLSAADAPTRDRQLAGIAALVNIAVSVGPPATSHDLVQIAQTGPGRRLARKTPLQADESPGIPAGDHKSPEASAKGQGPDRLIRNSLYLMLSSGLQAGFGFFFWVLTARLFSSADLGIASSLISAVTVISFISILGLNSTFVRYLPTAQDRNALMTLGIILVGSSGAVVSIIYIVATPVFAPRLSFIDHRPGLAIGFILLSSAAGINLLTDSIFIAARKSAYNAVIDGVIGGAAKLIAVLLFASAGAYGLFCASASGFVIAGIASIYLMAKALRWRPTVKRSLEAMKPLLLFSTANYAANGMAILPILIVPLIVLDRLGASSAGYYFIDFQMATLLYSAAFAVEQNFLAEGSQAHADWPKLRKRGWRITMALCLPPTIVLIATAHWVMLIFGVQYSQNGTVGLMVLAAGAVPTAANNWRLAILRLTGNLRPIIGSSVVYAVTICGLAWVLAPHGLAALCAAWPIGTALSAGVASLVRADGRVIGPGSKSSVS